MTDTTVESAPQETAPAETATETPTEETLPERWAAPVHSYEQLIGRYRTVTVALFKLGEVRALRERPGDWDAVRGLPKGTVSPLREYAVLAPTRAAVLKGFAQALADRHRSTVWAWNSPYSGCWELDWVAPRPSGSRMDQSGSASHAP
ncbi:hypothetical protein [Streptomyces triticiradicis]|uniref:Uncharacterized protein n=1 Tax=Streptomyces triticiradicis TaxID=2651189 RepID=A0A7J5D3E1_9ACTN|nr:hypothetical protein [Streptomyces triticiradicis]KAB1978517.1 hypothetical protein F8144_39430 [Streptomyces triticiradicis]